MAIIAYKLLFLTKVHPQTDQHVLDRNNAHKFAIVWHNFGSGSIFIHLFFFPITALWHSTKCNVIQQTRKKSGSS